MNKSELFHLREGTFQLILLYQSALLDGYHADIAEGNAKIERLQDKLQELESQKVENEQVISEADRKITLHKNSTRAEVFRLKGKPFHSHPFLAHLTIIHRRT